jgi:hypothetical protein
MVEQDVIEANVETLARLEALAARLTDADLARDLGGGWTVAIALAHMAFWDRRACFALERWARDGTLYDEGDVESINEPMEHLWRALPPHAAVELALEAARRANEVVAGLPPHFETAMAEHPQAHWPYRRYNHRREHLDQIEAALQG